ncbi:MAG: recombination protein O N-terminal domain-containing protein [Minisyncoccia bacterium]
MAHKIVITDGIVLGKRGVGEAHTSASLLTREVGLVYARATSARRIESKLRYGLEPLTRGRYSLVCGRSEWKVVGVEGTHRDILKANAEARAAAGRAGRLLLRLVAGEESSPELFDAAAEGFALLAAARERIEIENIECMLVLRLLWRLGYVANVAPVEQFLAGALTSRLVHEASPLRPALIRAINESLAATGL